MPKVKTHDTINTAVLVGVLSGLYYLMWKEIGFVSIYLNTYTLLVFSLAYLFATFYLSPDLDTNSKPYKRWGMLRILWWPYKVIFKHRGFSHNPILGPLSIILNLGLIIAALLLLGGVDLQIIPTNFIIPAMAGMVLSMEVHIISDSFVSKLKSIF
ncbi:metal-binding protein [Methanolobus sp.]|uniref:metal-binding protein n=1 Tax=Methanolobus sp. TaxID=1874737 RepID=UPI0025D6F15D|nr:metal-binding protein [Methanolobus sp.]